eukprot:TRINITY_DN8940_c1_g1_i1.p1 TRINITY_DN8940_c1_g1~~TRINITY_DN8940_c1_g1_i1.p1  ORF type:complete len:215 (+),score=47.52 TRINITY_DN8940_c1_g1_i1:58-645(+)
MQGHYHRRSNRNPPVEKATSYDKIRCGCEQNGFDNVRVVKGQMTLRCRTCEYKVKVDTQLKRNWRCMDFWVRGGCPNGSKCKLIHLYQRKRNLQERIDAHGATKLSGILQGLPGYTVNEKVQNSRHLSQCKLHEPQPVSPCHSTTSGSSLALDRTDSCSADSTFSASQKSCQKNLLPYRYDPYSFDTALVPAHEN